MRLYRMHKEICPEKRFNRPYSGSYRRKTIYMRRDRLYKDLFWCMTLSTTHQTLRSSNLSSISLNLSSHPPSLVIGNATGPSNIPMVTVTDWKGSFHALCPSSVCWSLESEYRFARDSTSEVHRAKSHPNETSISGAMAPTLAITGDIDPILNPRSKPLETASSAKANLESPSGPHCEQLLYNEDCIWRDAVTMGYEHGLDISQHDKVREGLDSEVFPRYGASQDGEASSVHDINLTKYILACQYSYSLYWQISIV